jgi:predicted Zn finger-like uncharacterized protein
MDVRCERCGTEYEFEDDRITEDGVTVKCSTCGHLFKIRKKSFVLTEPVVLDKKEGDGGESKDRNWMVRKGDGSILSFKELTTLQKWIVERKVSREDEISKSGENWKRLGGIAELGSFFQIVEQAETSSTDSIPVQQPPDSFSAPDNSHPGIAAPVMQQPAPSVTQPLPSAVPVTMSQPAVSASQTSIPQTAPPSQPGAPVSQPLPQPEAVAQPVVQQGSPVIQTTPQAPVSFGPNGMAAGSEPDSWGSDFYQDDEDDVVEKWKKRGRRKWYFIVPLLLIIFAGGGWYLKDPDSFMRLVNSIIGPQYKISELAKKQFNTGYLHFLKDTRTELDAAVNDLNNAISEAKGRYPEAMSILAEVHSTLAEKKEFEANQLVRQIEELEKQIKPLMPADGSQPKGEAHDKFVPLHNKKVALQTAQAKLIKSAREDLDKAKQLIDTAAEMDLNAFLPKRAKANYLRVIKAERAHVEVPLNQAYALKKDDPGLIFVDGASYAADPASLDIAMKKLSRALELQTKAGQSDLVRARFWFASVLLELKEDKAAKIELEQIVKENPGHQQAQYLLASLAPAPKEVKEPELQDVPKKPALPSTYEGWMNLADKYQRQERSQKAMDAYDSALSFKPNDVEALTGKALCFLDLGSTNSAINLFKRALKVNKKYGDALIGIAEAYKYLGKKKDAIVYYKKYLSEMPNGPEASVARRNIKDLK